MYYLVVVRASSSSSETGAGAALSRCLTSSRDVDWDLLAAELLLDNRLSGASTLAAATWRFAHASSHLIKLPLSAFSVQHNYQSAVA